jgi:hypothetical protein
MNYVFAVVARKSRGTESKTGQFIVPAEEELREHSFVRYTSGSRSRWHKVPFLAPPFDLSYAVARDERPVVFTVTDEELEKMVEGSLPPLVAGRFRTAVGVAGADPDNPHTPATLRGPGWVPPWLAKSQPTAVLEAATRVRARARGAGIGARAGAGADAPERRGSIPPGTPVPRPNGTHYTAIPLEIPGIEGYSDISFYRDEAAAGENILLLGPAGAGKSSALEAAFPDLITVVGTAETQASDLIGSWVPGPGGLSDLHWEDGPLIQALEQGRPLYIDELALIPPDELTPLYSATDGRGEVRVTGNPERGVVKAVSGFRTLASANPSVRGARIEDPLMSRFGVKVTVRTHYATMRNLGVPERMLNLSRHMAALVESGESSWAPQSRELLRYAERARRQGERIALSTFLNEVPEIERDPVAAMVSERWGFAVSALSIGGSRS